MTKPDSPPRTCSRGHTVPEDRDDCPVCGETVAGTDSQPGRSLWDVMGQNSTPTQPKTADTGELEDDGSPRDSTAQDEPAEMLGVLQVLQVGVGQHRRWCRPGQQRGGAQATDEDQHTDRVPTPVPAAGSRSIAW